MASESNDLRLAVLRALIAQHGPIPCIYTRFVDASNEYRQAPDLITGYVCREAKLVLCPEGVTCVSATPYRSPMRATLAEAIRDRARLATSRGRIEFSVFERDFGRTLRAPSQIAIIMRQIEVGAEGLRILGGSLVNA